MEREKWVDDAKGIAILLVILGHSIQYATPSDFIRDNNMIFQIIYSFHMPLFMLLAGYVFTYITSKYSFKEIIKKKFINLIVPCISWGILEYIFELSINGTLSMFSIWEMCNYFFYSTWFLWATFYCSIIVSTVEKLFPNKEWIYMIILFSVYLIPEFLNFNGAKRLLPFFIMGYFIKKYKIFEILEKNIIILLISVMAFGISVHFLYGKELITGFFGSLMVCLLIRRTFRNCSISILSKIGKDSLGIYVIQGILFYFYVQQYARAEVGISNKRLLIHVLIVFGTVFLISWTCSILLKYFKVTSKLFLGK